MSSYVTITNAFLTPSQVYGPDENLRYYLERVISPDDRANAPRFGLAGDGRVVGPGSAMVLRCMTAIRCGGHQVIDAEKMRGNAYRTSTLHGTNMAAGV